MIGDEYSHTIHLVLPFIIAVFVQRDDLRHTSTFLHICYVLPHHFDVVTSILHSFVDVRYGTTHLRDLFICCPFGELVLSIYCTFYI